MDASPGTCIRFRCHHDWRHWPTPRWLMEGSTGKLADHPHLDGAWWCFVWVRSGVVRLEHVSEGMLTLRTHQGLVLSGGAGGWAAVPGSDGKLVRLAWTGADNLGGEAAERLPQGVPVVPGSTAIRALDQALRAGPGEVGLDAVEGARLVLGVLGALVARSSSAAPQAGHLVRRASDLLVSPEGLDLPVAEIARRCGVSPDHLARCFRRDLSIGVQEFRLRHRMRSACDLLRRTTLPLATVARRSGYRQTTNFVRAFRGVVGTTPQEFRDHASVPIW